MLTKNGLKDSEFAIAYREKMTAEQVFSRYGVDVTKPDNNTPADFDSWQKARRLKEGKESA